MHAKSSGNHNKAIHITFISLLAVVSLTHHTKAAGLDTAATT